MTTDIDLAEPLVAKANSPQKKQIALAQAQALIDWLQSFHFPSQIRKSKLENVQIHSSGRGRLLIEWKEENNNSEFSWEKKMQAALKKVVAEDLGNMNATELFSSIPETDSEGRGLSDLRSMEKKMSVKVVFDDETGHVFLVGDSKKLEKKCFPIRNMVSHYHWRLSGADGGSFQS
jgi:hypothetical protein